MTWSPFITVVIVVGDVYSLPIHRSGYKALFSLLSILNIVFPSILSYSRLANWGNLKHSSPYHSCHRCGACTHRIHVSGWEDLIPLVSVCIHYTLHSHWPSYLAQRDHCMRSSSNMLRKWCMHPICIRTSDGEALISYVS